MTAWILESSLLVLLILAIRRIFMGKMRYRGIYALWLFVLFRFLVPVHFISTPFSAGDMIAETLSAWHGEGEFEPGGDTAESGVNNQNPNIHTEELAENGRVDDLAVYGLAAASSTETGDVPVHSAESSPSLKSRRSDRVMSFLFCGWALVSGFLFLWLILSNVNLNRRMKRNRVLYGKRGHICIYTVSCIKNPCLYGFFRPAIYLPGEMVQGTRSGTAGWEEVGQMITHEYVHYCHKDHIWAMFRILLVSVYWFDPFMWIAISCSKKDAELACDEAVIQRLGEGKRFSYGEMLVRLAADTSWGDFRYSLMAMSRKGKEMEKRIRAISSCRRYSKWILLPLVSALVLTICVTGSTGIRPFARKQAVVEDADGGRNHTLQTSTAPFLSEMEAGQGQVSKRGGQFTRLSAAGLHSNFYPVSNGEGQDSYEEVFYRYIETFTEAVNTGNTDLLRRVLAEGSDVYKQQTAVAANYFKRGIREEVKTCSISSVRKMGADVVKLKSKERIQVFYQNAASKTIDQTYLYTCVRRDQNWWITRMDEMSLIEKWE